MRCALLCVFSVFLTLAAQAQAANQSISPATYNALNDVQEWLQQENWSEAEKTLSRLTEKLKPSFGLALTYQLYGQLYLAQEQNSKALMQFEKALKLEKLAPAQEAALATNVAQLYLAQEDPAKAIGNLKPRLERIAQLEAQEQKNTPDKAKTYIQPMAYATLAMAYYVAQQYPPVVFWIKKALAGSAKPHENWWQILAVAYYEQKDYLNAATSFGRLISMHPQKEDYWTQQASMYQLAGRPADSLATLETAYAGGYLNNPNNRLLLIQLLINQGLPERGGRLLSQQLAENNIALNENNWRLLASAWQQGRERQAAIKALRKAAELMDNGNLLLRAAQLSLQNNDYAEVISDIEAALKKGLPDAKKGNALIFAGNSAFELQDYQAAKRYFQRALKEPGSASSAKSWLEYIANIEAYL